MPTYLTEDQVRDEDKILLGFDKNAENIRLYDFKHQFRQPDADALTIPLPVTSSGEPDWKYMEEYMRAVMEKSETKISGLQKAIV